MSAFKDNNLLCLTLNACSIVVKFEDILHVLYTINVSFDIIAITETWVIDSIKDCLIFQITHYIASLAYADVVVAFLYM